MVSSETSQSELFDILQAMIQPLGDLHTSVSAPSLKRSTKQFWRKGTDALFDGNQKEFADRGRWQLFAMTDQTHLISETTRFCNDGLHYGHLSDTMGYLRIRSFGNYSQTDDSAALEGCLDKIFADGKLKSLIIDVCLSFGGSDELGLAIASRLTSIPYLAYTVAARDRTRPLGGWSTKQRIMLQPSSHRGFRGPIAILTGPITMSAAESFVEALMGRTPAVLRIGENTQGVFCDVLDRHLPNGWTFGLPNAVYMTSNGMAYDVIGIPPNVPVQVFTKANIAERDDPALKTAERLLSIGK